MARIVVERFDAERGLFNVGHDNLERERQLRGTLSRASGEWEQLLKRPWSEIRAILLNESDEGQRLRSTHPFRGIVTEAERLATMAHHPPPWPHEPYDPSKIRPEAMEELLSEGISLDEWALPRPNGTAIRQDRACHPAPRPPPTTVVAFQPPKPSFIPFGAHLSTLDPTRSCRHSACDGQQSPPTRGIGRL